MAAILYDVRGCVTVPAQHSCEDVFRQKVRLFASDHQDRNVDGVPIFPEVYAVVPRVAERMRNVRIVQRLVALAFGLPFHAVNRQMAPMLVLQFSERCQDATKLQFRRVNGFETLWSLVEVGA